jgi:DNA-directed RNA polymerase specialized sigma24 family protein
MTDSPSVTEAAGPRAFTTTHWSVVQAVAEGESVSARQALEKLCRDYWHPVFAYVRRKGCAAEEAEDLTQEFFAQLIEREQFRLADKTKGKFRGFLLSRLDFFLAREWTRAHRLKRGGQFTFVSLEGHPPEERYQLEPAEHQTPETIFHRQWALTVLRQTMSALEAECAAHGKAALFHAAKHLLSGGRHGNSYAHISRSLAMGEGAARVAVHRLRQRYGELLRAEVAQTVTDGEDVDEELRFLIQSLSR